jgi:F-type H+-transporting ATPase subunit a
MTDLLSLDLSKSLNWDDTTYSGEMIMSFIVMGIVVILSIIIGIVFSHQDPLKPDQNKFVLFVETGVEKIEDYVVDLMGGKWTWFTGYAMGLGLYIFISFFVGISGLPNPLVNIMCPLSLGLWTLIMIHGAAVHANRWKYFHRYIEPFPLFLPINLLSMWSPMVSTAFRLFGNAFSGYALMTINYFYMEKLSDVIFGHIMASGWSSIWVAPLVNSWLHIYFDLFSGFIQALIFISLTCIWVSQEDPDEEIENDTSVEARPAENASAVQNA